MAVSELDKYEGRSSNRNSRDVPKPRKKKIDRDSSDASSDGSYASSSKSSSKRSTSTRRSRKSYSMGDRPMRLMNYRFVPTYQRRPWIFNGYRPTMDFFDALKTMFSIHNETGNIWTHFVGFIYVFYHAVSWFMSPDADTDWMSWCLMAMMFISLLSVFGFSTLYHTAICGSKCCAGCCLILDMGSIAFHISFAYFSAIYLAFWCRPGLRAFYMLWGCGLTSLLVVPQIMDRGACSKASRICLCFGTGSGVIPALHAVLAVTQIEGELFAFAIASMFFFYFLGGVFYFTAFPESKWPGKFDYIFHSHQWWHLCVLLAGTAFMHGLINTHSYQMSATCQSRAGQPGYFFDIPAQDLTLAGFHF